MFCVYFTFEWVSRFFSFAHKRHCLKDCAEMHFRNLCSAIVPCSVSRHESAIASQRSVVVGSMRFGELLPTRIFQQKHGGCGELLPRWHIVDSSRGLAGARFACTGDDSHYPHHWAKWKHWRRERFGASSGTVVAIVPHGENGQAD
eukprot:6485541-Amphidinium_carterae.1